LGSAAHTGFSGQRVPWQIGIALAVERATDALQFPNDPIADEQYPRDLAVRVSYTIYGLNISTSDFRDGGGI